MSRNEEPTVAEEWTTHGEEEHCRHCGVELRFIHMRGGPGWCHVLGGAKCRGGATKAEPDRG